MNGRPTVLERLAAAAALAALGGAILVFVVGAAANWQALAVVVAGALLAVVAGWSVLSTNGAKRAAAAIATVAGLTTALAGILATDLGIATLAPVAVLGGASIAAGQVALGRSTTVLRRIARDRTPAAPAGHPVLLINPWSGGGRADRHHLVDECRARGIEPIVLRPGDDLLQLAEDAIARGADVIGMAGGDGSQALVAGAAVAHDLPLVVVPAGTRNHFALDLGLDRHDVVGALDAFGDGVERRVDLAVVNGRTFVNNASLGLYAKVVQSPGYREAKPKTALAVLPELLAPDAAPLELRFVGPDGAERTTAHVLLVSNDPYQLHRFRGRGTRKRLDRGVLGIIALRIPNAAEAGRFVALEAVRRPQQYEGWLEWTAARFEIDADSPIAIGIDGEASKLDPPLVFETRPAALRVRLPRDAIGRSPSAKAVYVTRRSTFRRLVDVAAGRSSRRGRTEDSD
jgi:diacylglycerol kinase family enzyme